MLYISCLFLTDCQPCVGQKWTRVAWESYLHGQATVLGNTQIQQQPLSPLVTSMCLVHDLPWVEKGSRRAHSPLTAQYEDAPFTVTRTASKLVQKKNMKSWKLLSWRPTVSLVGDYSHIWYCLHRHRALRSSMKSEDSGNFTSNLGVKHKSLLLIINEVITEHHTKILNAAPGSNICSESIPGTCW